MIRTGPIKMRHMNMKCCMILLLPSIYVLINSPSSLAMDWDNQRGEFRPQRIINRLDGNVQRVVAYTYAAKRDSSGRLSKGDLQETSIEIYSPEGHLLDNIVMTIIPSL